MGFRRLQKAQVKKRPKGKDDFSPEPSRDWKKSNKDFKKYKKIQWSDDEPIAEV